MRIVPVSLSPAVTHSPAARDKRLRKQNPLKSDRLTARSRSRPQHPARSNSKLPTIRFLRARNSSQSPSRPMTMTRSITVLVNIGETVVGVVVDAKIGQPISNASVSPMVFTPPVWSSDCDRGVQTNESGELVLSSSKTTLLFGYGEHPTRKFRPWLKGATVQNSAWRLSNGSNVAYPVGVTIWHPPEGTVVMFGSHRADANGS